MLSLSRLSANSTLMTEIPDIDLRYPMHTGSFSTSFRQWQQYLRYIINKLWPLVDGCVLMDDPQSIAIRMRRACLGHRRSMGLCPSVRPSVSRSVCRSVGWQPLVVKRSWNAEHALAFHIQLTLSTIDPFIDIARELPSVQFPVLCLLCNPIYIKINK